METQIGYKQSKKPKSLTATIDAFNKSDKSKSEREWELKVRNPRNMDIDCVIVNDGSITHYDTAVKTGVLFTDLEEGRPTKTFVSIGYYPINETYTKDKNWMKFPCFEFDETFDPGIEKLIETLKSLIILACVHKRIHLKHQAAVVNKDIPVETLLSQILSPRSYYLRESYRQYKKIEEFAEKRGSKL